MAAPIGSQILSEVLPYLELEKDRTEDLEEIEEVVVPNVTGLTVKEADSVLKDIGLNLELSIDNSGEELDISQMVIVNQIPSEGIMIESGNSVFCDVT